MLSLKDLEGRAKLGVKVNLKITTDDEIYIGSLDVIGGAGFWLYWEEDDCLGIFIRVDLESMTLIVGDGDPTPIKNIERFIDE